MKKNPELVFIEGPHLIEEGLDRIEFIVYSKIHPVIKKALAKGIPCHSVSEKDFKKYSQVVTPQGIIAAVKRFESDLDSVSSTDSALLGFCVNIQDPGNLGTIIRAADAAGLSGIIVSSGTVDPFNQKVVRSTAGSMFHLPVVFSRDVSADLAKLKQKGFRIIAADVSGIETYWQTDFTQKSVILIGNEGAGLSDEILNMADSVVKVPLAGKAESLNAAMCASVIFYEALRQRMPNG